MHAAAHLLAVVKGHQVHQQQLVRLLRLPVLLLVAQVVVLTACLCLISLF
jgi:hypothetical protein